ncbi:MAG: hypothetical protein ACD_3C00018G0006 [uncultured bacterium (gcode 4)]|uniref:Uncharacterized protein n=1 Tax=uncultured bacterium (gcode 4) TaxID=1234023 RepID=K2G375_9BACT|nr:MAG: hypothetical protein ACD_3C00018G0006 [uncultured bacterium (gcode 4)]
MLNINIKKSNLPIIEEKNFVTSKKIAIDINLEWVLQISYSDRNIVDIIEKLIIDLLITKIDKFWDVYDSFSLVLEKLNKELRTLSKDYNLETINIFLWIIQWEIFHFSILGSYSIYLIKNHKIIDIAEWMQGKNLEFSYISSWNVNLNDTIFLSNLNLLDYVTRDDIFEITKTDKIDKLEIVEQILSQEAVIEQYNIISISNHNEATDESKSIAFDLIKSKFLSLKDKIIENEKVETVLSKFKKKVDINNKYVYVSLLSTWVLCAVFFLYVIINSIMYHEMQKSIPEQYKNKLIEAKMILERTNKDLWNKAVFDSNIKKAENMIFEVRWKGVFLNDVSKLLDYISILKKQSNWIETFVLSQDKAEIEFKQKDFNINWIFEVNKKYYFIGKNSIIGPYIKWEPVKSYNYPDWEEVVDADVTPEWNVYLLTKTFRILEFYKQEFKYVNVEWQKTWENTIGIKTFNGNLYLLSDKLNQIFRHKPGVNWFSTKSALIDEKDSKNITISDFAIDGGFYILKKDLAVDKFFTTPDYIKRSILVNNIKNIDYSNKSWKSPMLYVGQNLNYVYFLLDNKIWIFEADNRNYKDVKSLKYIWQLEPSEGNIQTIYIPKDGTIYVATQSWVYIIHFEVSDNKVIVR